MSRYKTTETRRARCYDCKTVGESTIEADTWFGVAYWTCPNCGTTQENPQSVEAADE